ncbi:MAG: ABC transporter ATP-binding protein [Bacteroidales bacterium]|nr:ABC transporter ATP-binding protein [Bacteroidales bacterium]
MLRPQRFRVLAGVLLGAGGVAASLAFVWISKRLVEIATGTAPGRIWNAVWIMAGIMAVQLLLRVAAKYWEGLIVVKAQNGLRASLFRLVMTAGWNGRDRLHSGDTVSRLEEDIRLVVEFLCVRLPETLVTLIQLVAASVYIFVLSPSLAWILLLIMPVAVLCSRLFFRRLRRLTNEIREGDARVQGHMQENVQRSVVVRMLGAVPAVFSKMDALQGTVYDKTVSRLNYGAVSRGFMQLGFAAGYALVFLWGVFGLRDGSLGYGTMVAFLQLVGQVQRPVAGLATQIPSFIRALSSEDRLMDLMDLPQEGLPADRMLPGVPGVRVSGLSFTYEGTDSPVIRNFDADFKPGTMTAVLGSTGAGKSTLIRLIASLLKPSSGRVVLYGADAAGRPFEAESCVDTRCNFMYVPQGNSLMSGTIRENLLLAKPDAGDEELREALHIAAADFVFELQGGLDTVCAEIGAGLSEGQAQRIAIARALLRPGGILILDEATSALDAGTESELLERLGSRYKGNKTIICITHRPAATGYADAIVRMG